MPNPAQLVTAILILLSNSALKATELPTSVEFFESRIRPILIQNCYECHRSKATREAGLALDFRDGLLKGGDSGPAIAPRKPDESLLLQVIEHRAGDLKMPPSGLQLSPEVLNDFRQWIEAGAIDPREHPTIESEASASSDWQKILEARKSWWSFQPIQPVAVPEPNSSTQPIDQFVNRRLAEMGLRPNPRASDEALIRRIYWNLIGLPPSRDEMSRWSKLLANAYTNPDSLGGEVRWGETWGKLVDTLLTDRRFGVRWARHWMDWIRYAESHGSEGDPAIVNAWLYRDYLIRALNESLPMDQMIREHIAGDLLPPRIDAESKLNQALIATSHWRMVFHGFSPVDAMEERVRFTDDQINTFSKAFLAITLSCARCHDHKFDPVSQADYYAIFGVLSSCRPSRRPANADAILRQEHGELRRIQAELRLALADHWQQTLHQLPDRLGSTLESVLETPVKELKSRQSDLRTAWENRDQLAQDTIIQSGTSTILHWDLTQPDDLSKWTCIGPALEHRPKPGEPIVAISGERALSAIHVQGVNSRCLSDKESARIESPDFDCPSNSLLWVLCEGDGGAALRYAVEDYPRNGTIYPVYPLEPGLRWIQSDLSYWAGDSMHVEISTSADAPLLTGDESRSWFRVEQVWILPKGQQPPERQSLYRRLSGPGTSTEQTTRAVWVNQLVQSAAQAIENWSSQSLTADQAELLDLLVGTDILPNDLSQDRCRQLIEHFRKVESELVAATRVACLEEAIGQDSRLLVRGDHRQPAEVVPRRFLEVIDGRPFESTGSGRRELAERLLAQNNPLTRRVLVNRVWQCLFGVGIVSTSDNFGRLGREPTHPELLDWLATRLTEHDWSLKALIRDIVTTETWLRSSTATVDSFAKDPANQLLGRASVRRYEAESIRDALFFVTESLDSSMYGPPQSIEGPRRSLYLPVLRNSLVPLLRTFDFPEPFTTVGKRDQTNVPAQSLALMNDPLVASLARRWAESMLAREPDSTERVRLMLESALARTVGPDEIALGLQFIQATRKNLQELVLKQADLSAQSASLQKEMEALETPVRESLRQELPREATLKDIDFPEGSSTKEESDRPSSESPDQKRVREISEPILDWNFSKLEKTSLADSLELIGSANIIEGALVLADGSYAVSHAVSRSLREKTLAAWVQLDNLDQRGGGVISVQTIDGNVFDSIVFGEQTPAHWLAGSNFFTRTESFQGEAELSAAQRPVHLAIVYQADGEILAYRNGRLYGRPYQSSSLQEYVGGKWLVSLGLRHLPSTADKTLSGKIWSASVFDYALSPEQISSLAGSIEMPISQDQLLAAMQTQARDKWRSLEGLRQQILSQQAEISKQLFTSANQTGEVRSTDTVDTAELELLSWTDFVRTVFTLKEFIYVP